jgi:hypothetical protein
MENKVNVRYTTPTRYDKAEYGSICKVMNENDTYTIYVQTSHDHDPSLGEHSNWVKIKDIFETIFNDYAQIPQFIHCCLEIMDCIPKDKPPLIAELVEILIMHRNKK